MNDSECRYSILNACETLGIKKGPILAWMVLEAYRIIDSERRMKPASVHLLHLEKEGVLDLDLKQMMLPESTPFVRIGDGFCYYIKKGKNYDTK